MSQTECLIVLGLPYGTTFDQVKATYRQLARKYHPDANNGDHSHAEKFSQIQEAYEVLKDVEDGLLARESAPQTSKSTEEKRKVKFNVQYTQPQQQQAKEPSLEEQFRQAMESVQRGEKRVTSINDFKNSKLKGEHLVHLKNLLNQEKYLEAIVVGDAMAQRFLGDSDVMYWQAIAYQRYGSELFKMGSRSKAKGYLNKAFKLASEHPDLLAEIEPLLQSINKTTH